MKKVLFKTLFLLCAFIASTVTSASAFSKESVQTSQYTSETVVIGSDQVGKQNWVITLEDDTILLSPQPYDVGMPVSYAQIEDSLDVFVTTDDQDISKCSLLDTYETYDTQVTKVSLAGFTDNFITLGDEIMISSSSSFYVGDHVTISFIKDDRSAFFLINHTQRQYSYCFRFEGDTLYRAWAY